MKRQSIALFALIAGGAAISWWLAQISSPDQTVQRKTEGSPDAYAEQLTIFSFDAQGFLHHKLRAPSMRYYKENDTTELDQPHLWQFSPEAPSWSVRGERAIVHGDGDTLFMPGPVFIDREGQGKAIPYYRITTRDLKMQTDSAYVETDQPIQLDSPDHRITAVGMQGWLQEPVRIKLLHKVRGVYEHL